YSADDEQIANLLAAGLAANLEMSRLYQTLADEHSTLKSVVESAPDGVVVVNPSGFILMANPAFHAMFGLQQQDLTGAPLMTTIDHPALHQLFTQENNDTAEIKLSDGRIMQASLEAVVSRFGEHIGWAAVLHDVTLLKELAHMKDEFVNTVSHDLKNPISSILLANDMLNRLGELNPAQENLRTRIHSTANYMNELVTDLLDLGRIEAGLGLEIRQFNLAKLVDEVLFALRANAEDKEIELVYNLPDELLIQGDYKRLRQVLLNIIGNAIKYTPAQGCVTTLITADSPLQTQPLIRIAVQDNGLGIPTADLPHIFDKFYRVQNEQTADIKGTGLGLAITKSIIEAHEGQIQVDSQMGAGTTFTILLPHLITE
ncbi:MAG: PAS domain-containing protein, partial [Anaerolineales bacterium]|nr:PAS domain-containing protein [Anaerolineales bacterium]